MIRPKKNKRPPPPEDCPLNEALRFLSGAWTAEILWFLREEGRRFGDLKRDLRTVSAKVLSARLRELEELGILTRTVHPTSPPTVEYALTNLGESFNPILDAMAEVSQKLRRKKLRIEG